MTTPASTGFSIGEAFSFGWERFKDNLAPLAVAAAAVLVVNIFFSVLGRNTTGFAYFVISLVSFFVSTLIYMGLIRLSLDIVDGRLVTVENVLTVFRDTGRLIPYIIASLIYSVAVGLGFIALIIPGIYLVLTYSWYGYKIVDEGLDAFPSLSASADITRGRKGELLLFTLALVVFNLIGLLLLVVGVLITGGISMLAAAHVYRQLDQGRA